MSDHRCPVRVSEPPGYWQTHRCDRRAKYEIAEGVHVCGIHRNKFQRSGRLVLTGGVVYLSESWTGGAA